ncbi:hypothetical protein MTO98_18755 [Mucilaginibacter sp. SMC90]|uniref:hypothetical protein n=1 Tax=Mucilaginibacter sp. SMC90 TaxID=2929803 RepID=UPI001FB1F7F6|nr:hypothetical protein [Mucilaginibacter sp. SMC90]UOE46443.1 hypothetical protein MTO98_18755 [Mucilaginibacter sp. SMC90]
MMIRKLLLVALLLSPFICRAQINTSSILLQMRNGKVYFDNVYALNPGFKRDVLFAKTLEWFKGDEKIANITVANEKKGEVMGSYITRINIGNTGNYYFVRFAVDVIVYDATYEVKVFDVYEKPIEKGISNEYSKIEYRWWDFRRGKPWSADDDPLFRGISNAIDSVLHSIDNKVNN